MRFLLGLLVVFGLTFAHAASSPEDVWYSNQSGANLKDPVGQGKNAGRMVKYTYDASIDGGSVGNHFANFALPKDSLFLRSFAYVVTSFTGVSGATVSVGCEDVANIIPSTAFTALTAGKIIDGTATVLGTSSGIVSTIGAPCLVSTAIGSQLVSTGKMNVYIEYVAKDAS